MRTALLAVVLLSSTLARAYDVTTAEARRETLLDYVAHRDDLPPNERAAWDRALRLTFGGTAMKDGTDEGVTVAKSVIAAAIFHGIDPKRGARGAYDAYHDTYRWVPPPIAVDYQILAFQGRKPKAAARELAFNFPRHFNEEIAPDLVSFWDEMLKQGKIPEFEVAEVKSTLAKTRELMRPMLRDKLRQGAELEARLGAADEAVVRQLREELALLERELARDFRAVAQSAEVNDGRRGYYERYAALSRELGLSADARPKPTRAVPKDASAEPKAPPRAETHVPPVKTPPLKDVRVPTEPKPEPPPAVAPAPFPGDALIQPKPGWQVRLTHVVGGWLGTPYLFGGESHRGIDCSAFVRAVFRDWVEIDLPRNSRAQFLLGVAVQKEELKPGDLIFFDTLERGRVTHVGVYVGDGQFAHASSSKGVTRAVLGERYYQRAYWGSKRVLNGGS